MVLSIDDPIPAALLQTITAIDGIQEAHPVTFDVVAPLSMPLSS